MKLLSRVVWSEGMYLGPHHFQVQSRYFEDSIRFAISSLWFASYGLSGVELDADALHNGTVSLLHARGVFLMAPALTMPGLPPLRDKLLDCPTTIVHGWKDDVVPVEQSIEFARRHGCALHILNSDHRLQDEVRLLKYLFEYFLVSLDLPQDAS